MPEEHVYGWQGKMYGLWKKSAEQEKHESTHILFMIN